MEMDSIKQMVIQASTTLYSTQDKEQRRTAEEWLNDFKKSLDAWYVADQILHSSRNEHVLFFAAQTIRTKIQSSFHELPLSSHESLKNSLMEHLNNFSASSFNSVQTQIYIALSDLIMLMNTWENSLNEVIERFTSSPDRTTSLIKFLAILPEEIGNKRLKLGKNRRDYMKNKLAESSRYVTSLLDAYLTSCLETGGSFESDKCQSALESVYKCLSSWIEEGLISPEVIVTSQLLKLAFDLLSNESTEIFVHDAVTNCLVNLFLWYPFNTSVDTEYKEILLPLRENVSTLVPAFHKAKTDTETEKCFNFCLIFTETCNALSYYLLNEPKSHLGDLSCINWLIMCGDGQCSYECFQKTFTFWFNVSEEIYTSSRSSELCELFAPHVNMLIECIYQHCRLGSSQDASDYDDILEFRSRASDLVADIVFIVQASKCFENMFVKLQSNNDWLYIESALFVMCSFAKTISPDEENCVTQVLQAILSLSDQVHTSVKKTSIRLIGELCDWLNRHPQLIDMSLNFVCTGFTQLPLCHAAATTMYNICTQCQDHMAKHLDSLVGVIVSLDNTVDIPNDTAIELLKGTVVVLSNFAPSEMIAPLVKICQVQLDGLQTVINSNHIDKSVPRSTPVFWLDRFTAIFRTIKIKSIGPNETHPCQSVVEQMWPTLSICLNKYQKDTKTTESCCKVLRFMLRSTEKHTKSILAELVNQIVSLYRVNHGSCFLYLGSILVDIYGTESDFKTGLVEMMQIFTQEAFEFIIKSCTSVENLNDLRKHPDTIDDFFRLSLRFMQRCPREFIDSPIFSPIMTLAVTSLNLDHRDANLSVTKFLSEFVAISHKPQIDGINETNQSLVNRVLNEIGQKMVENTINSTIEMTTRDTKDGIADVLFEILVTNRNLLDNTLANVFKSIRKTNQHGNEIVTDGQLYQVHACLMQSESTSDVVGALCQLEQLYL